MRTFASPHKADRGEHVSVGLLVLLVRSGDAMPVAIGMSLLGKRLFEFRSPVSLQYHDTFRKAPRHCGLQKGGAILTGQRRAQQDLGLLGVDINPGERKHAAKGHGIHLNDGPRPGGHRHGSPFLILVPLGADHVFLRQNLVDL
jgi:hypothetical protein